MVDEVRTLSRRAFLYSSALVAGSATLAACSGSSGGGGGNDNGGGKGGGKGGGGTTGSTSAPNTGKGSATKPLAPPQSLSEAPVLAAQVKAGKLPKVADRLPETPYVLPHNWATRGKYGGQLNMIVFTATGMAGADSNREFFYGHSLLRYLNDSKDIGPGLAESWSSNADATEWTFHFRKGLKWSDGHPFTTEDILFWWEDMVLPGHFAQTPPADCRSGKGTLAKITAVDDLTLKMTFDTPAPLTADHIAAYVNGAIGKNGPIWVLPKHYLKQFHPKYNPKVKAGWDAPSGTWQRKSDWMQNPDCPTMTGYKCKSFNDTSGVRLERNPYYYVVTKEGDQLPYIDEISFSFVQNAQVGKLQVQQGKVDFAMGGFAAQIGLADVSTLSQTTKKSGTEIVLWNSGSGTGSIFFLNLDYPDDKLRKLFREPKFRQAISHAFDRDTIRKSLYFETGTTTTGTMSPQSAEFHLGNGQQIYNQWRTAYLKHDPAKAKQLLADLGLKDTNGDGYVEFPDGSKLTIRIDYSSDISKPESAKDDQLVADCKKIGLRMTRNPIGPQAYASDWESGKLMAHTNWEVSNVGEALVNGQVWMVPIEFDRWAPLEGEYYAIRGTPQEHQQQNVNPWKRTPPRLKPYGVVAQLQDLYNKAIVEPDRLKRAQLVWNIMKVHIEQGPFFMGSVGNYPNVAVAKTDLKNVPRKENLAQGGLTGPWGHPTPAVYDPESFYWDDPTKHTT